MGLITFFVIDGVYREHIIKAEFNQELQTLPNVKVDRFTLWEGDSISQLEVDGKGELAIWYGPSKVPTIDSIKNLNTSFTCYFVDQSNTKTGYAYDLELNLAAGNQFSKWFPFQVNSLHDLVNHYDDIVNILNTFPQNPPLMNFLDSYGERQILQQSNPDYMIRTIYQNRPTVCDLYFTDKKGY